MDGRMAGQMARQTDGCREGWTDRRRAGRLASAAMEGWTARRMQGRTDRRTGRQVPGGLGRQMGAQRAGRMGRQTGRQLAGCWPLGERRCHRPAGPEGLVLHRRDPEAWRGCSCWGHPDPGDGCATIPRRLRHPSCPRPPALPGIPSVGRRVRICTSPWPL